MRKVIEFLSANQASEEELSEIILQEEGPQELARLYYYVQKLVNLGLVCYSVPNGPYIVATYIPYSTGNPFLDIALDMNSRYLLSRFAYSRREGRQLILESPLANAGILLAHWQASAIINLLAGACSPEEILHQLPGLTEPALQQFLLLLRHAGMLEVVDADSSIPEECNHALQQWEFHDLLFHAHSRMGRYNQPAGITYRFLNKIKPLPTSKESMSLECIRLYVPDMEKLKQQDYPFSLVLEERKSIREYADNPITVQQLGEFLYRSARVKQFYQANPQAGALYDASRRPYPGGGACYELEIYLCINKCQDLEPGLYHYAPDRHELERLSGPTEQIQVLLKDAAYSAGLKDLPPVSIHITARFQRVSWKYQSIAYSIILKDVGVLYQTMYLVAAAMDLAPSSIGSGHTDLLCQAAGLNYLEESAVGEYILGSKRV